MLIPLEAKSDLIKKFSSTIVEWNKLSSTVLQESHGHQQKSWTMRPKMIGSLLSGSILQDASDTSANRSHCWKKLCLIV